MIVAGFGFSSDATIESLTSAFSETGLSAADAIATAEDKSKTHVFIDFAKTIGAKIVSIDASALTQIKTHTQSQASQTHRNTGSVAEAAALAALGKDANLLVPRSISNDRMATCAIAQGPKS